MSIEHTKSLESRREFKHHLHCEDVMGNIEKVMDQSTELLHT